MHDVRIWATDLKTIELALGEQRFPMARGEGGDWKASVESGKAGSDYSFVRDGDGSYPGQCL